MTNINKDVKLTGFKGYMISRNYIYDFNFRTLVVNDGMKMPFLGSVDDGCGYVK